MEIMTTSLSNDVRSSKGLLAVDKKDVMGMQQQSAVVAESLEDAKISLPLEGKIPSSTVESTAFSSENGISDDEVDSALLCAMRDQRERVALLRLEQTMLDFMREETMGYIEVGGPGNSIVISPTGKIGKAQLEQAPAGRQTSFQRCCLHRLADRFNIIRENNADGMIRLVKVKDSQIPKRLLIDLDPSEYALTDENTKANNKSAPDVRGLAHKLSDSSLSNKKPPQKMMIMKRGSSSDFGSSNSLKGEGKRNSSRNRKKLSDKEKAYAEARARIFNNSSDTTTETTPCSDDLKPSQVPTVMNAQSPAYKPTTPSPPREHIVESSPDASDEDDRKKSPAVSKATWRNRRQEESDPDFQRLAPPSMPYGREYVATSPYAGYSKQQHYFAGSQQQPYGQPFVPSADYSKTASGSAQQQSDTYESPTAYFQGGGSGRGWGAPIAQRASGEEQTNVVNMDEFPSLR